MMKLQGTMCNTSDSDGPSPLPSPIFARCSPARGTVARKCREFYLQRMERTASMQKRWSVCEPGIEPAALGFESAAVQVDGGVVKEEGAAVFEGGYPLRKCRSSFDLAMDSLRKEISSLIAQDNDLFRQLLSLHDSIAELRERQRHSLDDDDFDDDEDLMNEEDEEDISQVHRHHHHHKCLSLESLSDPGVEPETSPESTLSSRSSLSAKSSEYNIKSTKCKHHHRNRYRNSKGDEVTKPRHRSSTNGDSRPLVFIDKSEICFRCRKLAPPYRRSSSIGSLYYLHEDMESYDSGIHLQGSHSDSDHEIFV